MSAPQTIVLADDHPIVRQGLRTAIEADPTLKIVAEASDGEAALNFIQEMRPRIAVLDIDMPRKDGFELARALSRLKIEVLIVFLTMHSDEDLFLAAMDLGARGYILKDSALVEIVTGLRAIIAGQYYVSPVLTGYLLNRRNLRAALEDGEPGFTALTATERHVLQLIAGGKSSKEIGNELCIHFRTVENHRHAICQKLGLQGSNSLVRYALQHRAEI